MKNFIPLLLLAAAFLAAAVTDQVIVSPAVAQTRQQEVAEAEYPITCTRAATFNERTGVRSKVLEFTDRVTDLDVVVHLDRFQQDGRAVNVLYHTFPSNDLVCILHLSEGPMTIFPDTFTSSAWILDH